MPFIAILAALWLLGMIASSVSLPEVWPHLKRFFSAMLANIGTLQYPRVRKIPKQLKWKHNLSRQPKIIMELIMNELYGGFRYGWRDIA